MTEEIQGERAKIKGRLRNSIEYFYKAVIFCLHHSTV